MSTMPCQTVSESENNRTFAIVGSRAPQPLHRLKTVRHQQGISLRRVARTMHIDVHEARVQEDESSDLPLSVLYQWRDLLDVPVADLLVESVELSPPVLQRARLLKLMKTVAAIHEETENTGVRRLAEMMMDQLVELMPELKGVSAWHLVSSRRRVREYGRAVERTVPAVLFDDH